jgi:hypothetical protein
MIRIRVSLTILLLPFTIHAADLPQFVVPGHETEMKALNEQHALHHDAAFLACTLWDAWLPMATLWASEKKREHHRIRSATRNRPSDAHPRLQQDPPRTAHPGRSLPLRLTTSPPLRSSTVGS